MAEKHHPEMSVNALRTTHARQGKRGNLMDIPMKFHAALMESDVRVTQASYAKVEVPRAIKYHVMQDALKAVDAGDEKQFDAICELAQDERYLERMAIRYYVATEYLDECVQKTKEILFAGGAQ